MSGRAAAEPRGRGPRGNLRAANQSSHGVATRVHGFATKTKALAREIPPDINRNYKTNSHSKLDDEETYP